MKKFVSHLLTILSVLSLPVCFITIVVLCQSHPASSAMEGLYYMQHYSWISWLFILIPIACLIFGARFKKMKNLIVGILLSVLLFGYGCFYLIGIANYSTNIAYLERFEEELSMDFPDDLTIITQDWTRGKQTSTENIYYKYDSVARFASSGEVQSFATGLSDDKWHDTKENFSDMLPSVSDFQTNRCKYFLLYCYETNSFSETAAVPGYNYVYMALNTDQGVLYITEFYHK